jgi:hypothetical protein
VVRIDETGERETTHEATSRKWGWLDGPQGWAPGGTMQLKVTVQPGIYVIGDAKGAEDATGLLSLLLVAEKARMMGSNEHRGFVSLQPNQLRDTRVLVLYGQRFARFPRQNLLIGLIKFAQVVVERARYNPVDECLPVP